MKETLTDFVAMMPLVQMDKPGWSWLGVSLSKTIAEKLLVAGLNVLPCYEAALLGKGLGPELFTNWESLSQMSAHLHGGQVLTGSCLFEEKRVKINLYRVTPEGLGLVAFADETKENFMRLLDRLCIDLLELFGKPANAQMREQIKMASSTINQDAYEMAAQALERWSVGDLAEMRKVAAQAQALDAEFIDPLMMLAQANAVWGDEATLNEAQRVLLTHLMSSADFRALSLVDDMLASAQREGQTALAADCLKARSAVQLAQKGDTITALYSERVNRSEDALERRLDEVDVAQLRVLRKARWTAGQAISVLMLASAWFSEAQTNKRLGQHAMAALYAQRAAGLFALLESPKLSQAQALMAG